MPWKDFGGDQAHGFQEESFEEPVASTIRAATGLRSVRRRRADALMRNSAIRRTLVFCVVLVVVLIANLCAAQPLFKWNPHLPYAQGFSRRSVRQASVRISADVLNREILLPSQALLPQANVDVTMPRQNGHTIFVNQNADLQSAIADASCGDTLVLQAGAIFTGSYTLPKKTCTGWVIIESSRLSQLPVDTRVGPSQAQYMAKIQSDVAGASPINVESAAHNYRLIGIEVTTRSRTMQYSLINTDADHTSTSHESHHIVVDRCYLHGDSVTTLRRAISFQVAYGAVIDSYLNEIHEVGADSQAIAVWNGEGPLLIRNNYLSAAGENILFGGADPKMQNLIPSDISILGNHITKEDSWRNMTSGYMWSIKNLLEFKNAQRVLVKGNVIEKSWAMAQNGTAVLMTPRNQDGKCPWCSVNDITLTHNLIRHSANGIAIAHSDNEGGRSEPASRVFIQNNLFADISKAYGNGTGGTGWDFVIVVSAKYQAPHDVIVDHNDLFNDAAAAFVGDTGTISSFQYTNNITQNDFLGTGSSAGLQTLKSFFHNLVWNKNILMGGNKGAYPAESYFLSLIEVGFGNPGLGDFQLRPGTQGYDGGTDGKDIGVWDWANLNTETTNAEKGVFRADRMQ